MFLSQIDILPGLGFLVLQCCACSEGFLPGCGFASLMS
jgi:hypothetical protein